MSQTAQSQRLSSEASSNLFNTLETEGFSIDDLEDINDLEKVIMRDMDNDLSTENDED